MAHALHDLPGLTVLRFSFTALRVRVLRTFTTMDKAYDALQGEFQASELPASLRPALEVLHAGRLNHAARAKLGLGHIVHGCKANVCRLLRILW